MTIVDIFTDFDGTVTGRAGNETVFTPFYQSLLQNYQPLPNFVQDYKETPMKNAEELLRLFEEKFGPYNPSFNYAEQTDGDLLMSPAAVTFFHELLSCDSQVRINIITKNRVEYIAALFRYQGFSEEEIAKLTIMCSGAKYFDVSHLLRQARPSHIYVLDDSVTDFEAMKLAVLDSGVAATMHGYRLSPGQFDWEQYLSDIRLLLPQEEELDAKTSAQPEEKIEPREPFDPKHEPRSNFSAIKVGGYSGATGFVLGAVLGISLAATGVFAPFGFGVFGVLALAAVLGGGSAVLSAVIGFAVAKIMEEETIVDQESGNLSYGSMQQSLSSIVDNSDNPENIKRPKVGHFPDMLKPPRKTVHDSLNQPSVDGEQQYQL
ncbi:hypothetical protein BN59_03626 [Legionella massiliensis]|uniref:Dot/Icm T4SS effector n=1 Tax=Legionella massiliensis TaxID=1034943 RepID=A0A078L5T4_9GAMM|nr:hypothetical protein [Legionella massiliensis]CDZ79308.1 hypothetical protein BN59_03626 [Legionella massiliensis]CEE15046.1 hypothetical protein BN1094_03626 [Legionella massiliensis]